MKLDWPLILLTWGFSIVIVCLMGSLKIANSRIAALERKVQMEQDHSRLEFKSRIHVMPGSRPWIEKSEIKLTPISGDD